MSEPDRLDVIANARRVLDDWTETLAQVLESMTDQRPRVSWQAAAAPPSSADGDFLWWEQPVQAGPETTVWVGAPHATWEYAGTLTLKAAGLETVAPSEAKNTWFEILGQSLSGMARAIGGVLGHEVVCEAGSERAPTPALPHWASVSLTFTESLLPPLAVGLSPGLVSLIASPPASAAENEETPAETAKPPESSPGSARSRTMDLLMEVELPVSISFGKTHLPMKDVLRLTTGSIVELNRTVDDPVEILVNQHLVARGEVVVVDGNYAVRIQEIASRQDRMRSIP